MRLPLVGLTALILSLPGCVSYSNMTETKNSIRAREIGIEEMEGVYVAPFSAKGGKEISEDDVNYVNQLIVPDYKSTIKLISNPLEASVYCSKLIEYTDDAKSYGEGDFWASFQRIHESKKDDCDGAAVAAAAMLSDDGFPPYIAVVNGLKDGKKKICHAFFVYMNQDGLIGGCGHNDRDNFPPACRSFESVLDSVSSERYRYNTLVVYDFSGSIGDLISGNKNNDPDM